MPYLQLVLGEGVENDVDALSFRHVSNMPFELGRPTVAEVLVFQLTESALEEVLLFIAAHSREHFATIGQSDGDRRLTHTARSAVNQHLKSTSQTSNLEICYLHQDFHIFYVHFSLEISKSLLTLSPFRILPRITRA